jgi:hypothetical protein
VYDVSTPAAPQVFQYINNRDFTAPAGSDAAGDLGPEGVTFIPAVQSPTGGPLLAVANEISGTVTLYAVTPQAGGGAASLPAGAVPAFATVTRPTEPAASATRPTAWLFATDADPLDRASDDPLA